MSDGERLEFIAELASAKEDQATKQDIDSLKMLVKQDIESLRMETKQDIKLVQADIKTTEATLRGEMWKHTVVQVIAILSGLGFMKHLGL